MIGFTIHNLEFLLDLISRCFTPNPLHLIYPSERKWSDLEHRRVCGLLQPRCQTFQLAVKPPPAGRVIHASLKKLVVRLSPSGLRGLLQLLPRYCPCR